MNNGLLTERALLGVFNTTSYINFGTADDPLPYPTVDVERSNYKGKQLALPTAKKGMQPDGTNHIFFQQEHPWVFDGCPYIDRNMYIESQPERYKGFLSSDFSKTDEFSLDIRTEQYRDQLRKDNYFAKKGLDIMAEKMKKMAAKYPEIGKRIPTKFDGPEFVYDVGKAGLCTTAHCHKCHKQTYYCPHRIAYCNNNPYMKKESGDYITSSDTVGSTAWDANYSKPAHARKPLIRDTFYRRANIFFPKKQPTGFAESM